MPPERVINIDTFEDLYVAELRINEKGDVNHYSRSSY